MESNRDVCQERGDLSSKDEGCVGPDDMTEDHKLDETNTETSTLFESVTRILKEADKLQKRILNFKGRKTDKEYSFMDEMLTRLLLELDGIDSQGQEDLRRLRRDAVGTVLSLTDTLERQVKENETS